MIKEAPVTLTAHEAKLITQFLRKTGLTGNFETLVPRLSEIAVILKKIEVAFTPQEKPNDNPPSESSN